MTDTVISAAPDWSLERAAVEMARRHIRHLVVVDRGELVGRPLDARHRPRLDVRGRDRQHDVPGRRAQHRLSVGGQESLERWSGTAGMHRGSDTLLRVAGGCSRGAASRIQARSANSATIAPTTP